MWPRGRVWRLGAGGVAAGMAKPAPGARRALGCPELGVLLPDLDRADLHGAVAAGAVDGVGHVGDEVHGLLGDVLGGAQDFLAVEVPDDLVRLPEDGERVPP